MKQGKRGGEDESEGKRKPEKLDEQMPKVLSIASN